MGFSRHWIDLVMMCVKLVSYSVIINGSPCGFFTPKKGLRQGHTISPYLFLLCAESFSELLTKALIARRIHGVWVCKQALIISHLLFADDSMIFTRATLEDCAQLLEIINISVAAFGKKVNFQKSEVFLSYDTLS